jgi:hypothetical protein
MMASQDGASSSIPAADLLPWILDDISTGLRERVLSQTQRAGILQALSICVRFANLGYHQTSNASFGVGNSQKHEEMITHDRFCSKWSSRELIVEQIQELARLNRRIARLSLVLMEISLDQMLCTWGTVDVEGVGIFRYYWPSPPICDGPSPNEGIGEWYARTLAAISRAVSQGSSKGIFSRLTGRSPILAFVDMLELTMPLRRPVPYAISLHLEDKRASGGDRASKPLSWRAVSPQRFPHPPLLIYGVTPTSLVREGGRELDLEIAGDHLQFVKDVKIQLLNNQITATDVVSNASTVKCRLLLWPTIPSGVWDVVVTDNIGERAVLPSAITIVA